MSGFKNLDVIRPADIRRDVEKEMRVGAVRVVSDGLRTGSGRAARGGA
jgi:hypothetical protein